MVGLCLIIRNIVVKCSANWAFNFATTIEIYFFSFLNIVFSYRCFYIYTFVLDSNGGRNRVVVIATRFGLGGSGFELWLGREFRHFSPGTHPVSFTMDNRLLSWSKSYWGLALTTQPFLERRGQRKSRAISLLCFRGRRTKCHTIL